MTSPSAGSGPSGPPDKQHHKLGSISDMLRAANHAGIAVCNRDCESGLPKGLPQAPSASCPRAVALSGGLGGRSGLAFTRPGKAHLSAGPRLGVGETTKSNNRERCGRGGGGLGHALPRGRAAGFAPGLA
jgi:hypothetical protein